MTASRSWSRPAFTITGGPEFAEAFHRFRAAMPGHFGDLLNLVRDSPTQSARARAVRATATALLGWLEEFEGLVRAGAREEVAARIQSTRWAARLDDFQREYTTFLAAEERLDRERASALVLFGWTAAEMIGRSYSDHFPEPVRCWVTNDVRRRAAGGDRSGEFEGRRKDGSRVWIDARVRVAGVADGPAEIIAISHDITARKRAEAALHLRDRAMRAAAQGILDYGHRPPRSFT